MIDLLLVRPWAWFTARLDAVLGRMTMYRLVVVVLGVVAAWSVVLGATGTLFFAPRDLLVSLAVAVTAAYVSNRLWSVLWRTPARGESALITGLLLFFLMWPASDAKSLGLLAMAAAVATLSKFVLRWRGRHVFNPAALGAVVMMLTGLTGAVWWVATPSLLVPVLLGGLLVLRRTGRTVMALVYVVVALALTLWRLVDAGYGAGTAFSTAMGSYPLVFFAVFMLTEPLTLPGRRWQRLVEAVVVAVVASVPFTWHLGAVDIRTSPELALVVGNLLVLATGARGLGRLEIVAQRDLAPGVREVTLRPGTPRTFLPGQFLDVDVPHHGADSRGTRRTFSLTSAPGEDLTIAFRVPERASSYKRALVTLEPGSAVRGTTVAGDFVLPHDPDVPLLLVAGGLGLTPFVSQLRSIAASGRPRDVVLVCSVSSPAEVLYADVLVASGARVVVVSPGARDELPVEAPVSWSFHPGRQIPPELIGRVVHDAPQRAVYLSGPPAMVDAVRGSLRAAGVRRIRTDVFFGY